MLNIFKKCHVIRNFPKNFPLYKKIIYNIIYFLTGIIYHPRKNLLSKKDLFKSRLKLKKGDIVLVGNLKETSSLVIGGLFTHSAIYIGHKAFINAVADGVKYMSLHHVFSEYDTLAILRLPKHIENRRKIIHDTIKFAKKQIGKPYDFDFSKGEEKFFCTELVNSAFHHAGYKTGVATFGRFSGVSGKIEKSISSARKALRPDQFIKGNFIVVFISHNLEWKEKKLVMKN
jgi:hypothetical protein